MHIDEIPSSDDPIDTRSVAHDLWPRRLIERREQRALVLPQRVFWPENTAQVMELVRTARALRRGLVPFGAGSGVCGGISPNTGSWVVDMKRMARIVRVDPDAGVCVVEPGVVGEHLERTLNARGCTLGHFPSSLYCSTVGGWVATRSAGQLSSRYGKIEDLVVAVEAVDGNGRHIRAAVNDEAGPAALQLLVGSEGALCIFTSITLRIRALPSHRWLRGFSFPSLAHALRAMQSVAQLGHAPSVLRLVDGAEAALAGGGGGAVTEPDRIVAGAIACAGAEYSGPEGHHAAEAEETEPSLVEQLTKRFEDLALFARPRAARRVVGEVLGRPTLANVVLDRFMQPPRMIVGLEGDGDTLLPRVRALRAVLEQHGARDLGDEIGARWLRHRHRVSYRMSRAFAAGSWVDTCEVACGWSDVETLYTELREALRDVAVVLCHFSHVYADGCSLYFTFAGGGGAGDGPRSALARYDLCWERALAVVKRRGAVLSHHHGVGRSKARALASVHGHLSMLRSLKNAFDPDGIMNPGVLGLGPRSDA